MAGPGGPPSGARRAVVVLGMHRSGTSLLAALLQLLGVDLGQNLLRERVPDNEEGYWEHSGIVAAQEAVLDGLGRSWHRAEGLLPLPPGWWRRPEIAPHRRRLVEIVRAETDAAIGVWGFKDPRTVRLLPLWREVFAAAGVRPTYLLAVRDPHAVAESLARRDGMKAEAGQLLWLRHTLDAFAHAGDGIVAVVDYDRWFSTPLETARMVMDRLGLTWTSDDDALATAVAATVRPDLRHGRPGDPGRLLPEVRNLHNLILASAPDAPPAAAVSAIRARLDDAERLLVSWTGAAAERRALEGEIAAADARIRVVEAERDAARGEAVLARERADAHARDHADLRRQHEALHDRLVEMGAASVAAEKARAAERSAERSAERAQFAAERDHLQSEIERRQRVLDAVMPDPAGALDRTWDSTSLRLVRPAQRLVARVAGRPAPEKPAAADPEAAARAVTALQDSTAWHMTGPIRAIAKLLGRRRP